MHAEFPWGYDPTLEDIEDYHAGRSEPRERPAEPGDVRFEVTALPEPELGATHCVRMIDEHGVEVERHITDNPYGIVEAFREAQEYSLEERLEPFGIRWQQEQQEAA
jgi:hypothetical protein